MRNYNVCLILIVVVFYLFSCIDTKVFVQKVEVEGPILHPMTKITSNKSEDEVETSFRFLLNTRENVDINVNGHTYVNGDGEYVVEEVPGENYYRENEGDNFFQFKGNNTTWNLPQFQFGLNLDIPLSIHTAIGVGIDYSNINSNSYWNGNLGLGFFTENVNTAWRFDFILNMTYLKTNLDYVVTERFRFNDSRLVYFYSKEISDNYLDYKFMITFNTKNIEFPVDLFFNFSFGTQRFFNKTISAIGDENEIELGNNPVNFGVGFYKNITSDMRIIIGTTINNQTQRNPAITYPVYYIQLNSYLF